MLTLVIAPVIEWGSVREVKLVSLMMLFVQAVIGDIAMVVSETVVKQIGSLAHEKQYLRSVI